jgi:hypothetical protein
MLGGWGVEGIVEEGGGRSRVRKGRVFAMSSIFWSRCAGRNSFARTAAA